MESNSQSSLLKAGIDSFQDMIVLFIDNDYNYLYFNNHHCDAMLTAYGTHPHLGDSIFNCITNSNDRKKLKINYDRALSGESHTSVEEFGEMERAFYETRFNPIKNESGLVIGVSAISMDVTSRIKSENLLHESSRRFRTAIDNFPYEFVILTPSFKILYINKLALERSKKPFHDVVGRLLNEIDEPEIVSKSVTLQNEAVKEKKTISKNIEIGPAESRKVYKISYVPVLDARGEIKEIFRILIDLTHIRQKETQLRALSNQLEKLREEERHRISRDIHDDLGQILTALKMDLVSIQKNTRGEGALQESFEPVIGLVDAAIDSARRVSFELRPGILDQTGLIPAIEWLLNQTQKRNGIECLFTFPDNDLLEIDTEKSVTIYRILQEIMTNISRHANASKVNISLSANENTVELIVTDNGKGFDFDTHAESLGLLGMKERARIQDGTLDVQSVPKVGTSIKLSIPIHYPTNYE